MQCLLPSFVPLGLMHHPLHLLQCSHLAHSSAAEGILLKAVVVPSGGCAEAAWGLEHKS